MLEIYDLTCSYDGRNRYVSWRLKGTTGQKSYQITVADSEGNKVWDSGVVDSRLRHNILLKGSYEPETKYSVTVCCKGVDDSECKADSEPFYSEISEWKAEWIEPDRIRKPLTDSRDPHEQIVETDPLERLDESVYFRKTINIDKPVKTAYMYVSAHGIYGLWINGEFVSDLLAPGFTSYGTRLEYQCIDVTSHLVQGENTIAFIVADGWYTGKIGAVGYGWQYGEESALIYQLPIMYSDGSKLVVVSDADTKWTTGAYRYADLYIGEYYDCRLEKEGWKKSGYDDSDWSKPAVKDYGYKELCLQSITPVKEVRTIKPIAFKTPKGEWVIDAGETVVGFAGFTLNLNKDQELSLEYSETLDTEGNFLQNIIGHNKNQTDHYVAKYDGSNTYCPLFTYHGFRYIRVEGLDSVSGDDFIIHVISTQMKRTGSFHCSDERLNILEQNVYRSQEGNMLCIPTDCPQREKTGWTGDAQVYAPTACYEQDIEQFFRHWLADMRIEQLEDGQVPHIIPYIPSHDYMKPPGIEGVSSAGWSDAAIILPWRLYETYGDKKILEENFDMISKYMESVRNLALEIPEQYKDAPDDVKERQKYLWNTGFHYGDWLLPSILMAGRPIFEVVVETGHIVASLMYIMTTKIMSDICQILGKNDEAADYASLNGKIKKAFCEEYVNEDGTMKKDYQGVYVLALQADVLSGDKKEGAIRRLAELIHANGDRLDTGFLSVAYLLPVLNKVGEKELARKILFQDACPSWLYEVKMGATTMWEYWNGYSEDGTPDECSMNHFSFGCVGEYLYRSILGIGSNEPGYAKLQIEPDTECGLDFANGSFETIWGKVSVAWKKDGNMLQMEITLPPDTEADIVLGNNHYRYGTGTWTINAIK